MARVLVIDDEPQVRHLVRYVLFQAGHEVSEAASGGEAVRLMEDEGEYDLLILDLAMGLVCGWEVLEEAQRRGIRGQTRVMVLTALDNEGDVLTGWRLGVDEYCTKPFEPYVLLGAVEDVLSASPEELERNRREQLLTTELFHRLVSRSAGQIDLSADDLLVEGE